ncbi:PepSY domain-containing protein [Novosphingobium aquae]|uniref:PepSY domain-containing protein n=1 Tax=Novosphingobium aquae TaxID=3133435 RepID=A0ABU8SD41_9SPHN
MRRMQRLARWHIWLGWVVSLPILIWLVSGLVMAAKPIDEVRGEHLRRTAAPVDAAGLVAPRASGKIAKIALIDSVGRAVWIVTSADKSVRRYDARTGEMLAHVDEAEARRIALAVYAGPEKLESLREFAERDAPLDLRRSRPSWRASFSGDTHIYIDADSGEVLALRTGWWRFYDFLWGLHIMDPGERENAHNLWIWTFGGLALVMSLFGTALLFRRRRRKPAA